MRDKRLAILSGIATATVASMLALTPDPAGAGWAGGGGYHGGERGGLRGGGGYAFNGRRGGAVAHSGRYVGRRGYYGHPVPRGAAVAGAAAVGAAAGAATGWGWNQPYYGAGYYPGYGYGAGYGYGGGYYGPYAGVPASPVAPMGGRSSADQTQYMKNLQDSGYDPKNNYGKNGIIVSQ